MQQENEFNKMKGELMIFKSFELKPNFTELGRMYKMDPRTVKKYYEGYEGKPKTHNKGSSLDVYREEIVNKLAIRRTSVKGVYESLVYKYGYDAIGTYSNFNYYVKKHDLRNVLEKGDHPRYEVEPGYMVQVDWKEDITLTSRSGEKFKVNIFHAELKCSRYSYIEISFQKRFEDVARGLINSFKLFGGVPKVCLFDNMPTVASVKGNKKKPTRAILNLAKDFGFNVRLCGKRMPFTKGSVESRNKPLDWIRPFDNDFDTLDDLKNIIYSVNDKMNIHTIDEIGLSPAAIFFKEKEHLNPLPPRTVIDPYLTPKSYKVSNEGLVRYDGKKYSVDKKLIGQNVYVDESDGKLLIYYTGKLVTCHYKSEKPINYHPEHYMSLLKGSVNPDDIESLSKQNLEIMDRILEFRKINDNDFDLTTLNGVIYYLNQNKYGRWPINYLQYLSDVERQIFINSMKEVVPYVENTEAFIHFLKQPLKDNRCRNLGLDCWKHDHDSTSDCKILTNKGYDYFEVKYQIETTEYIKGVQNDFNEGEKACEV